ncbi:hypothetical protein BH24GEM2_BH24GEM2_08600 [soil metagenome]
MIEIPSWHTAFCTRGRDPAPAGSAPNGDVILQGEREWLFTGTPDGIQRLRDALPGIVEPIGNALLLNFGNAVGFFEVPGLGRIEVRSGKWTPEHFDRMLHDLTKIAAGLPFASGGTAALPYDRSVAAREDVLYHAFVYLRSVILNGSLTRELDSVLREPHRHWERTRRSTTLDQARRIDARTTIQMLTGGLMPTGSRTPLARALRGHLPERVDEPIVLASHDTPENRFVRALLGVISGTTEGMRRVLTARTDPFARRIRQDCDQMERALRPATTHRLWSEIGRMTHLPASSTVLQRRRGYRELFGHWVRLRNATRVPLDRNTVLDLLEAKDVALLYELWCFFTCVATLESLLGPTEEARRTRADDEQVTAKHGLAIRWKDGTQLLYNASFGRGGGKRRSYSVTLRPDITLVTRDDNFHLFDAKFRLDNLGSVMPDPGEDADDKGDERRGTWKKADLYKMHTYRDAIPQAHSVRILYPGTEERFFEFSQDHPGQGVGAVPLVPGAADHAHLNAVLASVVA